MARKKKLNEDQPEGAENADETFGLPEIEYKPINREEPMQTPESSTGAHYASETPDRNEYRNEEVRQQYTYEEEDDDNSPMPKILGILAILLLAGAAYWFFGIYQPKQREAERVRKEQEDADAIARRDAASKEEAERNRLAAEQRRADSLANLSSKSGTVETLSARTNRYYVVVASAIDSDLLMDKARQLSANGVSCKIIPPFGKTKFSRLAIAEGDTYQSTQSTADGMKAQYGDQVWVVKY